MYKDCDEIFNENKNEILDLINQGWGIQRFQIKDKLAGVIDYNNEIVRICFIDGDDIKFRLKDFDVFVQFINCMKSLQV